MLTIVYVRKTIYSEDVLVFQAGRKHYLTVERCDQSSVLHTNKGRFQWDTIFEFPVKCNLPARFFAFVRFTMLPMSFTVSSILRHAAACKTPRKDLASNVSPGPLFAAENN